jgi:hypothetical protein
MKQLDNVGVRRRGGEGERACDLLLERGKHENGYD